MGTNFVSQLIAFLTSTWGIVGSLIIFFITLQARHSPKFAWLLVSLCCFSASLGKLVTQWVKEPPPLVFPLQQLRDNGRPLAVVLLIAILILGFWTPPTWRRNLISHPVKYLVILQIVIFIKSLVQGNFIFAILASLVFGSLILAIQLGPNRWLQDDYNFVLAVQSIAIVSVIFIAASLYQSLYNFRAIAIPGGGWFHGTTGNPQQAAALLSTTVPCFMFMIERRRWWDISKFFWVICLTLVMIALFLTASRTGAIMGIAAILFFYRQRGGALFRFGLLIGIPLVLIWMYLVQNADLTILNSSTAAIDKYLSGSNTRTGVWSALWRAFTTYPLFGAPLRGSRIGYGESSWLATAATLGILGLIPLILLGFSSLKMLIRLNQISSQNPAYALHTSTAIAGIISIFVGSISEAYLLGNITTSVLFLLLYFAMGQYLIEVTQIEQNYLIFRGDSSSLTVEKY